MTIKKKKYCPPKKEHSTELKFLQPKDLKAYKNNPNNLSLLGVNSEKRIFIFRKPRTKQLTQSDFELI